MTAPRSPAALLLALPALAAFGEPRGNRDIYLNGGADRERVLVEGAKKEGRVVLYTTLTVADSQALGTAFETKYGVKLLTWRGGSEKIVQRAMTEARAG